MVQHLSWDDELDRRFNFHPATDVTGPLHDAVRETCRAAAHDLLKLTPPSPEQTTALRKLQEAMMFANAAIACHAAPPPTQESPARGY